MGVTREYYAKMHARRVWRGIGYGVVEANLFLLKGVSNRGLDASPRGCETIELLGESVTAHNPRARLIVSPKRRWSIPLALGELIFHLDGSNDGKRLEYYCPAWANYLGPGKQVISSCYGQRMIRPHGSSSESPWERVLKILQDDPDSRRAILSFWDEPSAKAVDVSCVQSLQLFLRDGALHAIAVLRSSDLFLGFAYDFFLFSTLLEIAAGHLGVSIGTYTQFAGSAHIYQKDLLKVYKWMDAPIEHSVETPPMETFRFLEGELEQVFALENNLRHGDPVSDPKMSDPFWGWATAEFQVYAAKHWGYACPSWAEEMVAKVRLSL